jgi:hypothetical protein
MKSLRLIQLTILVLIFGLSACAGGGEGISGVGGQPQAFKPPTIQATSGPLFAFATETPRPTPEQVGPLPTPTCSHILTYLEDLTIPDGSQVRPGEVLDKRWLVQNNGTCNWNESYRLKLISDPVENVPAEQALYPARSGSQAIIQITFTAPAEEGILRSAWQAYSPEGEAFGDPIYIEVLVVAIP